MKTLRRVDMGWTGSQFNGGSVKDFLIRDMSGEDADFRWSLIDVSMRGSVAYGIAIREDKRTNIILAEALVILTRKEKGWLYTKELGETVHPYYYDAPKRLLDKLDALYPPLNENAIAWRANCRSQISKAKIKLKNGDIVRFASPMTFTFRSKGKVSADTFQYVEYHGKRNIFKLGEDLVRITNLNKKEFTIMENTNA
jgi:hypothetical protein